MECETPGRGLGSETNLRIHLTTIREQRPNSVGVFFVTPTTFPRRSRDHQTFAAEDAVSCQSVVLPVMPTNTPTKFGSRDTRGPDI